MSSGIVTFSFDHLYAKDEENNGQRAPLQIRSSSRGFYIGTRYSRLSKYYSTFELAEDDFVAGTFGRGE